MPKGVVNCGNCVNTAMSTLFGKTYLEIGGDTALDTGKVTRVQIQAAFEQWIEKNAHPYTNVAPADAATGAIEYIMGDATANSVSLEQWSVKSQEINGVPFDGNAHLYIPTLAMSTLFGKTFGEIAGAASDDTVYASQVRTAYEGWASKTVMGVSSSTAAAAAIKYIMGNADANSVTLEQWSDKSQEISGAPFDTKFDSSDDA